MKPIVDDNASIFTNSVKLIELGITRQGIAENPSSINKKTNEEFGNKWKVGEGVFSLLKEELEELGLSSKEEELIRPYHDLCDIDRYYIESKPSHYLIYSTKTTCPDIKKYPLLMSHLSKYKKIMDRRRETLKGSNNWWHLHWPRDEKVWNSPKIISIQMSKRPVFMFSYSPVFVPFSINVFVPNEDKIPLEYYVAVLNSKLLWYWFIHNAKKRGVGLEINGNVLDRAPIKIPENSGVVITIKKLVSELIILYRKEKNEKMKSTKVMILSEITEKEENIDKLVFDIYQVDSDLRKKIENECNAF